MSPIPSTINIKRHFSCWSKSIFAFTWNSLKKKFNKIWHSPHTTCYIPRGKFEMTNICILNVDFSHNSKVKNQAQFDDERILWYDTAVRTCIWIQEFLFMKILSIIIPNNNDNHMNSHFWKYFLLLFALYNSGIWHCEQKKRSRLILMCAHHGAEYRIHIEYRVMTLIAFS